jgi:predicted RNase H-like HicB family nuclease
VSSGIHSVPRQFDVAIEHDEEGYYVASAPPITSCHTQARSLDEVTLRIREAIELCLEVEGTPGQTLEFNRHPAHYDRSMSRIPRATGSELIAALAKRGFSVLRVKGSHRFLHHEDGRETPSIGVRAATK